jgi:dUTP pyrophosphatase
MGRRLIQMMKILIKRLHPDAFLPAYKTEGAAGLDVSSYQWATLAPGAHEAIATGIAIQLPPGTEAQIRPRSGLAYKHGVTVLNSPGTVDSDYRGELIILLVNHGRQDFQVKPGDRIAQMVIAQVTLADVVEVAELGTTARGEGGFGSTGVSS